jgi:hypothetical protein
MALDWKTCSQARLSRDVRFDGKFFIGVLTSGVYCRPFAPREQRRNATCVTSLLLPPPRSWVSSVSQMSSRMLARHACMDGNVQHGLACFAFD